MDKYSYLIQVLLVALCLISIPPSNADGLIYSTKSARRALATPDIYKKTPDFVEALGYKVETYRVTTEDGYILKLHRIPGEKIGEYTSNEIGGRKVIFLQHGLAAASDAWLMLGRKSLPMLLVENGYEVWLGNSRGSSYSKRHVNYTADDREYWDYTFHENGLYDLSAMLDHALAVTGEKNLIYVGHSRGTTDALVLLSSRPQYNKKIRLFIGLTPVAYLKNTRSRLMHVFYDQIATGYTKKLLDEAKFFYAPIRNKRGRRLFSSLCGGISFNPCWLLFTQFVGTRTTLDQALLPIYFSHFPEGESVKTLLHYLQIGQTDRFAQYDYGSENLRRYGHLQAPAYNLRRVTTPALLINAPADELAAKRDIDHLAAELPNVIGYFTVNDTNYSHNDILWGVEADQLLYRPILQKINEYGY